MKETAKDIKFRLDSAIEEEARVMEFLDMLGKKYRVRWLLACAHNFLDMHPAEVRKMLDGSREVIVTQKSIPVTLKRSGGEKGQEISLEKQTEIDLPPLISTDSPVVAQSAEIKIPKGMMRGLVKEG